MYKGLLVSESSWKLIFLFFLGFGAIFVSSPMVFEGFRAEDAPVSVAQPVNKKSAAAAFFETITPVKTEKTEVLEVTPFEMEFGAMKGFVFLHSLESEEIEKTN